MRAPQHPANEAQRLVQLHDMKILNTPPEERFDRLTRLARRLFNAPIALVSLVEASQQWFKSVAGAYSASTTPRDISFCGHAILQDDVMVVENALNDSRFHDNPLVTGEPHIRFYAGCPLRGQGGINVGTLCILGHESREFSADDRATLRDLAAMAEAELAAFQTATCDELTQITNRRGFMTLGQLVLNDCMLKQRPACLTFLDLDKFKQINDTLGHREGDRALMDFADAMKVCFRHSDLFARLGGDEFVVLFNGLHQPEADALLSEFRHYLQQQTSSLNRRYALHFSSGIVEFASAHPQSLEQMLEASDARMYAAKKEKKAPF
ncbi:sensor domain-containing diguanylate cyclase [Candidatus Pantoea deserta]|uniref:Sensor domain-containing diguanylate cyclase n=1 Tax=Candidatus Pantoea deserta TaxID=1869313 RepID=A0A3N4P9V0_9GAMM|nr:sensor domain-containing diguanylate cyclase [Pantoea deserta]RPE01497.1 sensor domain-containing diguanylate cyclase [Pantoea deserta]